MSGQLFIISAPSGAGKSTILTAVGKRVSGLGYSISHTTRKPRGDERNGVDYHFVDDRTFTKMINEGAFVEWAKVYDNFYGTSSSNLQDQTSSGLDVLMDVDIQGGQNIKDRFPDSVLIFLLPPSLEELERRLRERGTDNEPVIRARMESAADDIKNCVWYDYIIVNDKLEKAIDEAQSIIVSKRCATARQLPESKKLFDI
ncbi:MAG: guanylate kinase [Desulfobacteraceae bacterium]|uniref:Guanylate kinase n=1 Tax=Candidatus Desulfacyla euxinica TaxID=2841693 RepID=A0A8J6MXP5_9DELT|nr:guanylate kinase [Candidatus Desulfacyla euxinica]MBL6977482.1 guanylate kinase [Desulfobacteraceae bacterium]MBL7216228.1 guanylate kinase [Desulfobacteraceae bacterium]